MSEACPTPDKARYPHNGAARRGARYLAQRVVAKGQHFDPLYVYRCPCGGLHLTLKQHWDGVAHELLYEISDELQAFAQERPAVSG